MTWLTAAPGRRDLTYPMPLSRPPSFYGATLYRARRRAWPPPRPPTLRVATQPGHGWLGTAVLAPTARPSRRGSRIPSSPLSAAHRRGPVPRRVQAGSRPARLVPAGALSDPVPRAEGGSAAWRQAGPGSSWPSGVNVGCKDIKSVGGGRGAPGPPPGCGRVC